MSAPFLIVGGSSGIGAAVASLLHQSKHSIFALSRTEGALAELAGVEHHVCDVLDTSVDLPDFEGPLAGLAYMPGSINLKPFRGLSEADFRHDWELNCLGATRVLQKYLPNLKKHPGASVVLMSTVAVGQGMPYHASIASAKGAVEGLTRALAAELAPGIRVNAVAPSLTDTPLASNLLKSEAATEQASKRHPLARVGHPQDAAQAISFLLGEASSWVTGQIFHVDGGLSTIKLL